MSYSTKGPKPFERASKSSHHHVINDPAVSKALAGLHLPPMEEYENVGNLAVPFEPSNSEIGHIVAIDGGYTEVPIRDGYPTAAIHFFQFGALHFTTEDLHRLEKSVHVAPEDMQKLKNISRLKLPLATSGARRRDCSSLKESVRKTLYEFLMEQRLEEDSSLMETLAWFVFRGYQAGRSARYTMWELGSNPYGGSAILLNQADMAKDYTFVCPETSKVIFLSDVFRLHELVEEEGGAAGVAGYVAGIVEHLILLHVIRNLLKKNRTALKQVLFIMDRPTGWFGVTATMHTLMLELASFLFDHHELYLAGLEKSGAFVEHAALIRDHMPTGSVLLLSDAYIYKFISPGEEDPQRPYASSSYYGHKIIFKSRQDQMYVVSLPVKELFKAPRVSDIPNLMKVLTQVEQLHCDMYENALLPVALANKLVSLSAHPSSQILKTFAKSSVV